ncbi:MAG: NAD(P)-dependent oxidoreductase [Myxococcota bacterium]
MPLRVLSQIPFGLDRLKAEAPEIELVEVPQAGPIPKGLRAEVLLTTAWGSPNLAELIEAAGVRWIHTVGTGVDRFPLDAVGGRILTCSRGASAIPISEWVLAVMLAFEKRLPEAWVHGPPQRWAFSEAGGLYGRTLGLIGLGGIGAAIARRALAFDMRVLALRRTSAPSPLDGVRVVDRLDDLLTQADHLALATAATPATRHIIGQEALAKVKRGVHLVNIARGALVDQDALREALDDGRVARASLDVCDPEPLPEGHWLYTHPGVRLSPHTSWGMPEALDLLYDTFVENLQRWRRGDDLVGRVNLEEGY